MIILFGLGNNEPKYLNTKHNIGRLVLENFAHTHNLDWVEQQGCKVAKLNSGIWLVYSLGYMNNSGLPLSSLLRYYKLDSESTQIIVVQDDSDQLAGNIKLVVGGGTAGHNGIISCYQHLKSLSYSEKNIWRLKIGIRPEGNKLKSETFVLSSNSELDIVTVKLVSSNLNTNLGLLSNLNLSKLQNCFNTKATNSKPLDSQASVN